MPISGKSTNQPTRLSLCRSTCCVDMQETNVTDENFMYFLTDTYRDSASETIHFQAVQKDNCTSFNRETCWTTLEQSPKY